MINHRFIVGYHGIYWPDDKEVKQCIHVLKEYLFVSIHNRH